MDPATVFLFLMWAFGGSSAPPRPHGKGVLPPEPPIPPGPVPPGPPPPPPPAPPAPPGPTPPQPPPWPSPVPKTTLPPFPGSGWEADEPPPPEVVARAWDLLLHEKMAMGDYRQEMTGGRWITYRKELHPQGKTGITAYRLKAGAQPGPSPGPGPGPAPASKTVKIRHGALYALTIIPTTQFDLPEADYVREIDGVLQVLAMVPEPGSPAPGDPAHIKARSTADDRNWQVPLVLADRPWMVLDAVYIGAPLT